MPCVKLHRDAIWTLLVAPSRAPSDPSSPHAEQSMTASHLSFGLLLLLLCYCCRCGLIAKFNGSGVQY